MPPLRRCSSRAASSTRRCSRTSPRRRPPSTSTSSASGPASSASGSRRRSSPRRRGRPCPPRRRPAGLRPRGWLAGALRAAHRRGHRGLRRSCDEAARRGGALGAGGTMRWNLRALGHIDHRKVVVIDGRVGWVGGAGIEDHFEDGRFHDLFLRVTGPVVAQLQLVFLAGFRWLGGRGARRALEGLFPALEEGDRRSRRSSCTTLPAATARSPTPSPARSTTRARRSTSSTRTSPTAG